ncbi:MAG: HEAT repeat domain-containing protein [Planctomycetes bacterium]|nr:HEAT repeat domain-containing protein [Planctomycetota bacterium]
MLPLPRYALPVTALLALLTLLAGLRVAGVRSACADDDDAALKSIQGLLVDANPEVRISAVRSLARFPADQATPLLLATLDKETALDVSLACVDLLGDFRDEKAVPALLKVFARRVKEEGLGFGVSNDLDSRIRETEDAARKAKEPDKQNKLRDELKGLQKAKEVRRESHLRLQVLYLLAIEALGKIGSKDAVPKLVELAVSDSPTVRYASLGALSNIRDAGPKRALEKYLSANNPEQRLRAVQGIDDLDAITRPGVEDPWVRKAIARMIVADVENADRGVAGQALGWAMDLGANDGQAINDLPRILGYRDLLRSNDSDNRYLVDYELLALYLKHKVVRRALRPPAPRPPAAPGGTVESR